MTVLSATQQRNPGTGIPTRVPFADPALGDHFSAVVPAGHAWRLHGGACHVAGSAAVANRTPCLWIATAAPPTGGAFPAGAGYYYVGSNGQDYNHDANQTVVFYDQEAFTEGPPFMTVSGQTWNFTNNPAGLVYNPVGLASIWLPAGTVVSFYMHNIQPGDQLTQCALWIEDALTGSRAIDGLGAPVAIANPAAGAGFVKTVPAGRRWRIQGGSCLITTTAAVVSRFPHIEMKVGNRIYWFGSQDHAATAGGAYNAVFHRPSAFLTDLYVNRFVPVAVGDMWLPPGTDITVGFENIQAADQVSDAALLIEDVPA